MRISYGLSRVKLEVLASMRIAHVSNTGLANNGGKKFGFRQSCLGEQRGKVDGTQGHYSWSQGMGILGDKVQECQEFVTFLPTSLLFICKRGNASLHSTR